MPPLDDDLRLRHMLEAARKAVAFTEHRTRGDLDTDEQLALALTRLVEIIGEAAASVSGALKVNNPAIPWRSIISTRNRLIHGYFDVDLDILWNIVTHDLPILVRELQRLTR
jgi:uncharacterized protein with HEPN domain